MVLTADITLPEESELTVEEVNLSTATLRAGSFHLGKYCEHANNVSNIVVICQKTIIFIIYSIWYLLLFYLYLIA